MNRASRLDFWLTDMPAYLLAGLAAFMLGLLLVHWAVGVAAALTTVVFMARLGPAFKRVLAKTEQP